VIAPVLIQCLVLVAGATEAPGAEAKPSVADAVFEHVTDSRVIEFQVPLVDKRFEWRTPEWGWDVAGHHIDLSITKHLFWMWVASLLLVLVAVLARNARGKALVPKGGANIIEMVVLFIRDEIAVKNMGEHLAERYTPYLCTVFFFILFCALLGLFPYTATAVGNVGVTATLAGLTFLLTQGAAIREMGVGGYFGHLVPAGVPLWLYPIMLPVEILGLFTKPFALCIRLFANMVAGHIVIFFLLGLIYIMNTPWMGVVSVPFAIGIYLLEIFVALVQSYIFTMLTSLFIGMAAHPH
jgi:F-type H+-transporting ATPase subunit a